MKRQSLAALLTCLSMTSIVGSVGASDDKPNPLDDPDTVVNKCNNAKDKSNCSVVALIDRADVIYSGNTAAVEMDLMGIDLGGSLSAKSKQRLQGEFKTGFDAQPITRLLDEADKQTATPAIKALIARHREILLTCLSMTAPTPQTTKDHKAYSRLTKACGARAARSLDAVARALNQPTSLPEFDFRKSRWGDTQQAVLVAEGKPVHQTLTSLVFESSVADLKAMAVYHFAEGKLTDAGYVISETHMDDDRYVADFKTVTDGLTTKYGKAVYSLVETEDSALKARPDRWGRGIVLGELSLRDDWDSSVTEVDHLITSDNFKVSHIIRYESHEFAVEREKARAATKASGL